MSAADFGAAGPVLVFAGGACLIVVVDLFRYLGGRALAWLGAIVALASTAVAIAGGPGPAGFGGSLARDGATIFFTVLIGIVTAAALLLGAGYVTREQLPPAEVTTLVLFSASGAVLMLSAGDLLVLFLGLELLSLPLYVLTGLQHGRTHGDEGALKYFLLGAAISAVLLYGIALLYAATGTIAYEGLGRATRNPLYLAGLSLVLAGLAFKAALVPFHAWAPDAYESAPTPVTAQMAVVAKVAAFGALLRLVAATRSGDAGLDWEVALATVAALSIVIANLSALGQRRVKRLLAYSSISHAGFIAMAAAAVGALAAPAVAFYLAVYAALTFGAFAVVALLANDDPTLDDLAGLARRRPLLVGAFGMFLFGLTGFPPTAGFIAKLYVFEVAARGQLLWLVAIGVLASVVSAAYYLRVLLACFAAPLEGAPVVPRARVGTAIVVLAALAVLIVGIVPGPLLDAAQGVRF
ncbi:MAG TPA: NADH-quinone oxidoreductase subunit N [Candidatus Limnocylindria bacterium]|nr:NADH-quinone oxidoreductase subunit N [Candidatus Limnocylindria bacterium]